MKTIKALAVAAVTLCMSAAAYPCSRVVFRGDSTDVVMVGRTLDWRTPIPTNIYVYPAGMKKVSMSEGPRFEWTSKYASVLAVGYDGGATEGMNDRGLSVNGLFCRGSEYKIAVKGSDMKCMSLAVIVSFFLDNFTTVDEVEAWLRDNEFGINGATFDGGTVSLLHWGFTDLSGTTLVMEYDSHGNMNLYKSRDYQVLTNNPQFPEQLAIAEYWNGEVGGVNMLPGTVRSSDRFARATFFITHQPSTGVGTAQAFEQLNTLIDNVSVPANYEVPGQPNLSMTQWRSISDLNNHRYYFKFADQLGMFYIDMSHLLLTPGSPVLKLDTSDHADFFGCVNDRLKVSEPFSPMW